MPWYPDAVRKNIPPGSSDPRITPRIAILHVDAGNADTLYGWFNGPSGGVESHFFVKKDGTVEQYRDTNWQADANLAANDYGISIETQGYGAGEWTPEQLVAIKRLLLWINKAHPAVKLEKCKSATGSGIAYHVQFGAPGPWAPVAKSCPGPDRVKQYNDDIVPWLRAGAPEPGDDDLSAADVKDINANTDAGVKKILDRINQVAKVDRERDRARQSAVLDALKTLPTSGGDVSLDLVEQAVRNVFADAAKE